MARSGWSLAPDDDAAEMYLWSLERLDGAGLRQYEISNVARPGRESRHNLKYWQDGEWLGFGCGAHSTLGGVRSRNVAGTEDYIAGSRQASRPPIDRRQLTRRRAARGGAVHGPAACRRHRHRRRSGRRYGVDVWGRFGTDLAPFVAERLLVREGPRLRLTRDGMLLANEIMAVFV